MVVFQEHGADEPLEVPLAERAAQKREIVLVLEVGGGQLLAVEPARQRRHRQRHAVGHAEVALAHDEFGARERRLHECVVEPAVREGGERLVDDGFEALGRAFGEPFELDDREGLQKRVSVEGLRVVGEARVEQRALERRLVASHHRVDEDVDGHHARALARLADHVAERHARILRRGGHAAHHAARLDGGLQIERVRVEPAVPRVAGGLLVGDGGEVRLVQKREHRVEVDVAVEREVAVVQAVMAAMLFEEALVGEVGDGARRAARLEAIGRVGEERRLQLIVEHRVRIGERPFHLVVHHAVEDEARRALGAFGSGRCRILCCASLADFDIVGQFVVPALLLEDGALLVDGRVQHRVQVHVHEVEQVLVVRAGHGVHGLVGKRHRVQERLHRAFQQVHERLFDGELPAAAQHRVLEDVEHPRVVGGRGLEGDGERLVRVVVGEVEQPRAALFVIEHVGRAVDFGKRLARAHGEAVQVLMRGQVHGAPFGRMRGRLSVSPIVSQSRGHRASADSPSPHPQTPVADAFPRPFFGHETAFWHGFRLPLAWTLAKAQVEFCQPWEKGGVSPEIVPERR